MKVYLSGPMSGHPGFNIVAFDDATDELRVRGFEVVSPAEVDGETTREILLKSASGDHADLPPSDGGYKAYIDRDREILRAGGFDAIVTLPGWERSPGANREVGICEGLGVPQIELSSLTSIQDMVAFNRDRHVVDVVPEVRDIIVAGRDIATVGVPKPPSQGCTCIGNDACGGFVCGDAKRAAFTEDEVLDINPLYDADGKFITHEDNPLRQRQATGGVKDNRGKSRVELLPFNVLMRVGHVLGFGSKKYKPHNWRLGLSWSDTVGSALHHIFAFAEGEDMDAESGACHVDNAICQLMFLSEYYHTKTGIDDRWSSLSAETRNEAAA